MPTRGRSGHIRVRRDNPLVVLHTRETSQSSVGGTYPWPPHMSISLTTGVVHQHIEFSRTAYALHHSEPNRRGGRPTYQIEIGGRARDVPHYDDDWYEALAHLLAWFHHNLNVPLEFPLPFGGSETYGEHGKGRTQTAREWEALTGIVGHQHAFDNRHWDPGHLDVVRLQHFLGQTSHASHEPEVIPPAHEPPAHHDLREHPEGVTIVNIPLPILKHVRPNTKGQHVKNLQALLNAHGASLTEDGAFGPAGERAVKEFQSDNHLSADGVVGANTWRKLL